MKQSKITPYPSFFEDVMSLYGPCKVYGPYVRNRDRRKFVLIYLADERITKLYAKVKLEIKLGRRLTRSETVDHVDENPLNDRFDNLQLLSLSENASKSHALNPRDDLVKWARSPEGRTASSQRFRGEKNPLASFSDREARQLRHLYTRGQETVASIQEKYQVSKQTVRSLLTGKTYPLAGGPLWKKPLGKVGRPKKTV